MLIRLVEKLLKQANFPKFVLLESFKNQHVMRKLVLIALLLSSLIGSGQENLEYQKPPQEILELVDIQRAPWVLLNENRILWC